MNSLNANPYAAPQPDVSESASNLLQEGDRWTVDYEMNADDLRAFTLHHYFKTPVARRQFLRHWFTMTTVVIFLGATVWFGFSAATPAIGIVAFGVLYGIGFPWLYRARVTKLSQILLSGGRNVGMLGAHRVQISPDGLFYRTEAGESLTYWRAIERIDRDASHAYIYLSSVSAIVVARREFPNSADFEAFIQQVQSLLVAALAPTP